MSQRLFVNNSSGLWYPGSIDLIPNDGFRQLQNMWIRPDMLATVNQYGTMPMKTPFRDNLFKTTMPAEGRSRGLFQYSPTSNLSSSNFILAMQNIVDYSTETLYVLDITQNIWTTLKSDFGFATDYHADFAIFNNYVYLVYNYSSIYKWNGNLNPNVWGDILMQVQDKGASWSNIAGATLTWNLSATVTSDIDIHILLVRGQFIRKSSGSLYADEVINVDVAGTTITLRQSSLETGASGVGAAQHSSGIGIFSTGAPMRFIINFKDKLFTLSAEGTLYWSVTDDPDDWSGIGSGSLNIFTSDLQFCTGLEILDDLMFIFKDNCYYVYRWTGDLTNPLVFMRKFDFGCVSDRTIKNTGDSLFYFTGTDIRVTNGTSDQSILSPQMTYKFQDSNYAGRESKYFSLSSQDDGYPFAVLDETRKLYELYLPNGTNSDTIIPKGLTSEQLSSPAAIDVVGNYAYIITNSSYTGGGGLTIYDITDKNNIIFKSRTQMGGVSDYAYDIKVVGNYAYVCLFSDATLRIYDISNPSLPVAKDFISTGPDPYKLKVVGNYVYLTSSTELEIYDITDKDNIVAKDTEGVGMTTPREVDVVGNYAYTVSLGDNKLSIYDISDPAAIVFKSSITTGLNDPVSIVVDGDYAYVCSYSNSSLAIFDISNPLVPLAKGISAIGLSAPFNLQKNGNNIYISDLFSGLVQYNATDVDNPVFVQSTLYEMPDSLSDFFALVNLKYLSNYIYFIYTGTTSPVISKLIIFDVSAQTEQFGSAFYYDYLKGQWIGESAQHNEGYAIQFYTNSVVPTKIWASSKQDDQLYSYSSATMDYAHSAIIRSKAFDFGAPQQQKKVYWIEFVFHPATGCNTTLNFNYWDSGETFDIDTTNSNKVSFVLTGTSNANYRYRKRIQFGTNGLTCYQFAFYLDETSPSGTNSWGIISYEIAYDVVQTT